MNNLLFEIVTSLMDDGLTISVSKNKETGEIEYNLNTNMKSGCVLVCRGEQVLAQTRYKKDIVIGDIDDLLFTVANDCKCGRDYMSYEWSEIFRKYHIVA